MDDETKAAGKTTTTAASPDLSARLYRPKIERPAVPVPEYVQEELHDLRNGRLVIPPKTKKADRLDPITLASPKKPAHKKSTVVRHPSILPAKKQGEIEVRTVIDHGVTEEVVDHNALPYLAQSKPVGKPVAAASSRKDESGFSPEIQGVRKKKEALRPPVTQEQQEGTTGRGFVFGVNKVRHFKEVEGRRLGVGSDNPLQIHGLAPVERPPFVGAPQDDDVLSRLPPAKPRFRPGVPDPSSGAFAKSPGGIGRLLANTWRRTPSPDKGVVANPPVAAPVSGDLEYDVYGDLATATTKDLGGTASKKASRSTVVPLQPQFATVVVDGKGDTKFPTPPKGSPTKRTTTTETSVGVRFDTQVAVPVVASTNTFASFDDIQTELTGNVVPADSFDEERVRLEAEKVAAEDLARRAQEALAELQLKYQQREATLKEQESQITSLQQQLQASIAQNEGKENEAIVALRVTIAELQAQVEALQKENADLRSRLQVSEADAASSKLALAEALARIKELEAAHATLVQVHSATSEELSTAKQQVLSVSQELSATKASLKKKEDENSQLVITIRVSEEDKAAKDEEIARLKERLGVAQQSSASSTGAGSKEIEGLQELLAQKVSENEALAKEISVLKAQLALHEATISELRRENDALKARQVQLVAEKEGAVRKHQEVRAEFDAAEEDLASKKREALLQKQEAHLVSERAAQTVTHLAAEVDAESQELRDAVKAHTTTIAALQAELAELKKLKAAVSTSTVATETGAEIEKPKGGLFRSWFGRKRDKKDRPQTAPASVPATVTIVERETIVDATRIEALEAQLRKALEKLAAAQRKLDKQTAFVVQSRKTEIANAQYAVDASAAADEVFRASRVEVAKLQEGNLDLAARLAASEKAKSELKEKYDALQARLEEALRDAEQARARAAEKSPLVNVGVGDAEPYKDRSEDRIAELQAENDALAERLRAAEARATRLEEGLAQSEARVRDVEAKALELEKADSAAVLALQSTIAAIEAANKELLARVKQLERAAATTVTAHSTVSATKVDVGAVDDNAAQLAEARLLIAQLQADLGDARKVAAVLAAEDEEQEVDEPSVVVASDVDDRLHIQAGIFARHNAANKAAMFALRNQIADLKRQLAEEKRIAEEAVAAREVEDDVAEAEEEVLEAGDNDSAALRARISELEGLLIAQRTEAMIELEDQVAELQRTMLGIADKVAGTSERIGRVEGASVLTAEGVAAKRRPASAPAAAVVEGKGKSRFSLLQRFLRRKSKDDAVSTVVASTVVDAPFESSFDDETAVVNPTTARRETRASSTTMRYVDGEEEHDDPLVTVLPAARRTVKSAAEPAVEGPVFPPPTASDRRSKEHRDIHGSGFLGEVFGGPEEDDELGLNDSSAPAVVDRDVQTLDDAKRLADRKKDKAAKARDAATDAARNYGNDEKEREKIGREHLHRPFTGKDDATLRQKRAAKTIEDAFFKHKAERVKKKVRFAENLDEEKKAKFSSVLEATARALFAKQIKEAASGVRYDGNFRYEDGTSGKEEFDINGIQRTTLTSLTRAIAKIRIYSQPGRVSDIDKKTPSAISALDFSKLWRGKEAKLDGSELKGKDGEQNKEPILTLAEKTAFVGFFLMMKYAEATQKEIDEVKAKIGNFKADQADDEMHKLFGEAINEMIQFSPHAILSWSNGKAAELKGEDLVDASAVEVEEVAEDIAGKKERPTTAKARLSREPIPQVIAEAISIENGWGVLKGGVEIGTPVVDSVVGARPANPSTTTRPLTPRGRGAMRTGMSAEERDLVGVRRLDDKSGVHQGGATIAI